MHAGPGAVSVPHSTVNARIRAVVVARPRRVAYNHANVQPLLSPDALVVRWEQRVVHRRGALIRLERVRQNASAERRGFVVANGFAIDGFDVHRGDVVRQQHYLVGVNLPAFVLAPQGFGFDKPALHQPRYERPRPNERVYDVNARVSERCAELRV